MMNDWKMAKEQLVVLLCAMAKDEILDAEFRVQGYGMVIRLHNGQMFYISVKELCG